MVKKFERNEIYKLQMAYKGMFFIQIFLRIMNYIFSDLKQPEINIFSELNLPKVYTFSDLKWWEYHIFSELGIFLKFVFGIDVSCRREGGKKIS